MGQANPRVLEGDYSNKSHKCLKQMIGKRLIYADKGTKNKVNTSLIKKIGDGLKIENEVLFGFTDIIDIQFKLFICSINLLKIGKDEDAVFNRYKQN
jgi:hypothetical protein